MYELVKVKGGFKVQKKGGELTSTGRRYFSNKPLTKENAKAQMRALYANENKSNRKVKPKGREQRSPGRKVKETSRKYKPLSPKRKRLSSPKRKRLSSPKRKRLSSPKRYSK
jgi:hypothetical protein